MIACLAAVLFLVSNCAVQSNQPVMKPDQPAAQAQDQQQNGSKNSLALRASQPPSATIQPSAESAQAKDSQKKENKPDITGDGLTDENSQNPSDSSSTSIATGDDVTTEESENSEFESVESQENSGEGMAEKKEQPLLDEALEFCDAAQVFWQKGELENALDALDNAYLLILKVDPKDDTKLFQQKEDLRYLISKRILEIYASRNIVVNGNHKAIPLEMNHHIKAEINLFTTGREKAFFQQAYYRAGKFRPYIVKAFKEAGLPEELSWLPLIESGFKVTALSKARALGLWQFIPSTGYKFGLKRDKFIDERIDPYKSTEAAIAYLKALHGMFGDWSTVLAAYNCGEGRVLHVIGRQNINYLDNFWDLYERLPVETARYVPRFLATLHIVNHPEKYGLQASKIEPELEFETIEVTRQVHLKDIARIIDMPIDDLKELNPELRYSILPPERYALKVAPEKGPIILANLDRIPISAPPQPAFVWHKIRPGETLSGIARRYRTSANRILQANNLKRAKTITAGRNLKIPQDGYMVATAEPVKGSLNPQVRYHHVKSGDSLWNIAQRYGTTTTKIQELNGLNSTRLTIGQVLKLAVTPSSTPKQDEVGTYSVKHGDTPFTIAKQHQMALEQFLRLNKLTPRSKIFPGQQVFVE